MFCLQRLQGYFMHTVFITIYTQTLVFTFCTLTLALQYLYCYPRNLVLVKFGFSETDNQQSNKLYFVKKDILILIHTGRLYRKYLVSARTGLSFIQMTSLFPTAKLT